MNDLFCALKLPRVVVHARTVIWEGKIVPWATFFWRSFVCELFKIIIHSVKEEFNHQILVQLRCWFPLHLLISSGRQEWFVLQVCFLVLVSFTFSVTTDDKRDQFPLAVVSLVFAFLQPQLQSRGRFRCFCIFVNGMVSSTCRVLRKSEKHAKEE